MLNNQQYERYSRNILIGDIGESGQSALLNSKVLVCGCGGLGSTVIANLVSLGVGHLGIIDSDTIEISNLNRQYLYNCSSIGRTKAAAAREWIENYSNDVEVKTFCTKLDNTNYKKIVNNYDILVDCFDSFKSKFLLNDIALKTNKPLVHGGVSEFKGQVTTIIPNKTACLRCLLPDADLNTYVIKGVVSPTVSVIASIESMEVLKLILNIGELLTGKILFFDGLNMQFRVLNIKSKKNCAAHKDLLV